MLLVKLGSNRSSSSWCGGSQGDTPLPEHGLQNTLQALGHFGVGRTTESGNVFWRGGEEIGGERKGEEERRRGEEGGGRKRGGGGREEEGRRGEGGRGEEGGGRKRREGDRKRKKWWKDFFELRNHNNCMYPTQAGVRSTSSMKGCGLTVAVSGIEIRSPSNQFLDHLH